MKNQNQKISQFVVPKSLLALLMCCFFFFFFSPVGKNFIALEFNELWAHESETTESGFYRSVNISVAERKEREREVYPLTYLVFSYSLISFTHLILLYPAEKVHSNVSNISGHIFC